MELGYDLSLCSFQLTRDPLTGNETSDSVLFTYDGEFVGLVPPDDANKHRQLFDAWVAAGNSPVPAV